MADACQRRLTQSRFAHRLPLCNAREGGSCDARHHSGLIAARLSDINPTDMSHTDSRPSPALHRHMSPERALSPPSGWIGHRTNGRLTAQSDEGHSQVSDRTTASIRAHFRWACGSRGTGSDVRGVPCIRLDQPSPPPRGETGPGSAAFGRHQPPSRLPICCCTVSTASTPKSRNDQTSAATRGPLMRICFGSILRLIAINSAE